MLIKVVYYSKGYIFILLKFNYLSLKGASRVVSEDPNRILHKCNICWFPAYLPRVYISVTTDSVVFFFFIKQIQLNQVSTYLSLGGLIPI